jgi:hypothetical protein
MNSKTEARFFKSARYSPRSSRRGHPACRVCVAFALMAGLMLSGCGSSSGDRALSGAGIGAAVGGVGGLMLGAPVTGAAVGAAAGAVTGAVTDKKQVNLGKPIWR